MLDRVDICAAIRDTATTRLAQWIASARLCEHMLIDDSLCLRPRSTDQYDDMFDKACGDHVHLLAGIYSRYIVRQHLCGINIFKLNIIDDLVKAQRGQLIFVCMT